MMHRDTRHLAGRCTSECHERHFLLVLSFQGEVQSLVSKARTALRATPPSGARDLLLLHGSSLAVNALLVQVRADVLCAVGISLAG